MNKLTTILILVFGLNSFAQTEPSGLGVGLEFNLGQTFYGGDDLEGDEFGYGFAGHVSYLLSEGLAGVFEYSIGRTKESDSGIEGITIVNNYRVGVELYPMEQLFIRPTVGISNTKLKATAGGITIDDSTDIALSAGLAGGYRIALNENFNAGPVLRVSYSSITGEPFGFSAEGNAFTVAGGLEVSAKF